MDNRIMKLIIALGKFSAQPRQYRIIEGLMPVKQAFSGQ